MNKSRYSFLFAGWLALTLALLPVLRAQEAPPAPPVPAEPTPAVTPAEPATTEPAPPAETPVAEKTDEAAPADDKAVAPEEKKADSELRELGADEEKPASTTKKKSTRSRTYGAGTRRSDGPPMGDHTVSAGSTQHEAVSVFGDTTVDGHVTDAAVSVFGNTTINGSVDDAAVSVFGTTTVNGHVKGEAIAVMGDVILGPDAVVDGQVVAVLGKVVRGPGSKIHGGTQQIGSFGPFGDFTGLRVWFTKCLLMGRPLAFDSRLMWAWYTAFGILAFYALIALIAPTGVQKCVDTLEQRPGSSLLAALLTMLLTPVAYLLLVLTLTLVIGFVLLPLFSLGLFFAAIFGKIVMLAWLGRRCTKLLGDGPLAHPVFGVLIGGVIMLLLYTVPIGGFVLYKLMGILGLGVVVYTLILMFKASRPPKPAVVAAAPVAAVSRGSPGRRGSAAGRRDAAARHLLRHPAARRVLGPVGGGGARCHPDRHDVRLPEQHVGRFRRVPVLVRRLLRRHVGDQGHDHRRASSAASRSCGSTTAPSTGAWPSCEPSAASCRCSSPAWASSGSPSTTRSNPGTTRSPARPSCGCRRARRCCKKHQTISGKL